tara:strand:- start:689 stop:1378 length:690 start_codon:yes stop_codon:yes gene_type:complete
MKSFKSFISDTDDVVEQYLQEFERAVVQTHQRVDLNSHTFFVPLQFNESLPNKLIASALQGDEPAGWMGLLEFVKNNKPANANVSYLPIFSKETFRSGLHEDDAKRNPNHHIPYNPSRETARLLAVKERWLPLASGGFLDLHEDPWRGEGYAFIWSDTGDLGSRMVGLIEGYFPLFEGGRIERDDQGMIGDYLASLGVTPSVTSETPVLGEDLDKRVGVNVEIIKEFLK